MLLFIVLVFCVGLISAENSTGFSKEEVDSYYPSQTWSDALDWRLLKALSGEYNNVLISPISLKIVLALLYEGSSGNTERQFQNVLKFPAKSVVRENYKSIIETLQPLDRTEYILNLGTRIFLEANVLPQQQYAAKASQFYHADIEQTLFSSPKNASQAINSWVEKLTNGKVAKLVNADDLEETIMLITNAVYFKGTWRHQFPKNQTVFGKFYVSTTEMIDIPYMSTTAEFFIHESPTLEATILRLPYKGSKYSLFIVLPTSKGGLNDLIKKINLRDLHEQLYYMDKKIVQVSIPKFKFNFQAKYAQLLEKFGLRDMFQNTASFPGIARGNNTLLRMLQVSDIIQKSGIELDEEGSVVYAATDIIIGNKIGIPDYVFNATHPFLYFIEEVQTGSILFLGAVRNPIDSEAVPLPNRIAELADQVGDTQFASPQFQPSLDFGINSQNQWEYPQAVQPLQASLQPHPDAERQNAIINRFNYFDLELLREFSDTPQNVFLSPASIKMTLAMILEGAKGHGAQEISEALRIPNIKDSIIKDILRTLLQNLNDKSYETFMETANSIFVSEKENVLPEYASLIAQDYDGKIQKLDFKNIPNAVSVINNWVSNVTRGVIRELVGPQSINQETSVLLANALYFKGKWEHAFEAQNTKTKCFKSPKNGCVMTKMMRISESFNYNYINKLSAHAVEIPYEGPFSMLILLPSEDTNIRGLLRDIQHFRFRDVIEQLKPTDLSLEIPKFGIEYSTDLVEFLLPLRVREIFGPKANLTGIIEDGNVKISNLIHKTKIEVDEFGTTAAAATGAIVIPLMGSTAIVADRPFVFFIYHKLSKNVIFEGILTEPDSAFDGDYRIDTNNYEKPVAVARSNFPKTYYNEQRASARLG